MAILIQNMTTRHHMITILLKLTIENFVFLGNKKSKERQRILSKKTQIKLNKSFHLLSKENELIVIFKYLLFL